MKYKKIGIPILTTMMILNLTACSGKDMDGNIKEGGLVIRDHGHRQESRTKVVEKSLLKTIAEKIRSEKQDGLYSLTGSNVLAHEMNVEPFQAPQTEEDMNKLGHLPHLYEGDESDIYAQAPYPDTLAQMLATMMPLTHEPIKWGDTNGLSSDFGPRALGASPTRIHAGTDLGATGKGNPPQYSVWPGEISYSGVMRGYGNIIIIKHGNDFETRYAHLQSIGNNPETGSRWKAGDKIKPGDEIGKTGNTGGNYADHVHFEIRFKGKPRDPYEWLKELPGWEDIKRNENHDGIKRAPGDIAWPSGTTPFTLQDLFDQQRAAAGTSGSVEPGTVMSLPVQPKISFTYMNYSAVTSRSSRQFKLLNNGKFGADSDGFWKYQGKEYAIAMGSYYGTIGDRFEITLESGTRFLAVMGDAKADQHTKDNHRIHHKDDSIVEFLMDQKKLMPSHMFNHNRSLTPPVHAKGIKLDSKIKTVKKLSPLPDTEYTATTPVWR